MQTISLRSRLLLLIVFILFSFPVYATTIKKIVVFGDSLSDNGNIYNATTSGSWLKEALCKNTGISCTKVPAIPQSPPYYQGRFSNGPVWVEDLGQLMNLTRSVTEFSDYAYGGAWAEAPGYGGENAVPDDIGVQVSTYINLYPYEHAKAAQYLFVIWAGGNDYLSGRSNVELATTKSVEAIQIQIHKLIEYGAKIFLIPNLPNLGLTPWAASQGANLAANLTSLSQVHNKKLAAMLAKEQSEHPDVKFVSVDVMQYFSELMAGANPQLKNVKDACYGGTFDGSPAAARRMAPNSDEAKLESKLSKNIDLREAVATASSASTGVQPCGNPDEYLFWDHVHPTKVVHQLLANYVSSLLKQNNIY